MALTPDYFKDLVKTETKKLNQLCEQWVHIMDNESDITEEGFGQIRSTIGKTKLFIDQRFKQFNGLIDDCELKRGVKETKVDDLQGFWDMIFYQILDLHHSFQHLNQLKDNQWRELEAKPKDQKPMARKKTAKVLPKENKNKPVVRSRIREQIQNLKNKKPETKEQIVDNSRNESFGEKENKTEIPLKSETKTINSLKSIEKQSINELNRNVLKRTTIINAIKK